MKSLINLLIKALKTYIWIIFVLIYSCRSQSGSGSYQTTTASYYADKFNGKKTASGEIYRHHKMTAANKTLPFGTQVEIVNVENNKSVIITVNDRGPLKPSRQFDLSQGAFKKIGSLNDGVIKIRFKILK
ncbi:MAG: septal ring lytic transglycosylase RlpA family lipoprotein [Chryseobacterium sp.]|nr:MAG: septal ring lytic transglycosylase RlpA family lipoprotein [Chryseobacterium sp.]